MKLQSGSQVKYERRIKRCAHWCTNGMTIMGTVNCFLIGCEALLHRKKIHTYYHKFGQKPMAGEIKYPSREISLFCFAE